MDRIDRIHRGSFRVHLPARARAARTQPRRCRALPRCDTGGRSSRGGNGGDADRNGIGNDTDRMAAAAAAAAAAARDREAAARRGGINVRLNGGCRRARGAAPFHCGKDGRWVWYAQCPSSARPPRKNGEERTGRSCCCDKIEPARQRGGALVDWQGGGRRDGLAGREGLGGDNFTEWAPGYGLHPRAKELVFDCPRRLVV
eukprot:gene13616-biopygen3109